MEKEKSVYFEPPGIEFFDGNSQRRMKYVYPDADHWTKGWLLCEHPDGNWFTLRKATDSDIAAINKAVADAHHHSENLNAKL